ncbi:MAG: acetyl-CoA carboxylase biotin carboxylase subunit [Planctomycetota bacterium]
MFKRILIANRGEIALRIIRACTELGIETVCVYSEADKSAIYLRFATETICIGPGPALQSYLDIQRIIAAAEVTDASAIHPGYGFLSENAEFANICRQCKIEFIGPSSEAIRLLGDKAKAKELAKRAKVPTVPGSDGVVQTEKEALRIAAKLGYPVLIKAAGGGGGRGIRLATNDLSLRTGLNSARAEAQQSFKNPDLYLEKLIRKPRHIEFQMLGDNYGNIIHLGERDCSMQRRKQKILEECPSPFLTEELRKKMGDAALRFAHEAKYTNAGTIEFLVDPEGNFYFIEMNARIQVEHPITEMTTGIDLVKQQIRMAFGEKLQYKQEDIKQTGHAIECRINAEDPYNNFRPCPGKITMFFPPSGRGVRLDSHVYTNYVIPPYYDSMIGKLITWRENRKEAITAMRRALQHFILEGIPTTKEFLDDIISMKEFRDGQYNTEFLEDIISDKVPQ